MKVRKPISRQPPDDDPSKFRVKKFGVVEDEDLQIFIHASILKRIVEYSRTNLHRELGGVMIGNHCTWKGHAFIIIEDYIEARLGESRSASFKFTHDSFSEITRLKEQKYPDPDIMMVGWHHTHPSFGIFLSGMDLFIHQGYFNLPWQVALVVDPVADKLCFFQWKKGEIQKCGFYTVAAAEKAKAS